jgi:hypothetical protein
MAPTGMAYGDHAALMNQERSAAMSQADPNANINIPPPADGQPAGGGYQGGPFGAESARPHEPITHGVDIGPGGGAEILPLQHQPAAPVVGPMTQLLAGLAARDQTGVLANLYQSALASGA